MVAVGRVAIRRCALFRIDLVARLWSHAHDRYCRFINWKVDL